MIRAGHIGDTVGASGILSLSKIQLVTTECRLHGPLLGG